MPLIEEVEYRCPDCHSITPVMVGITECLGCGRALRLIQVAPDRFVDLLPDDEKEDDDE